MGEETKQAQDQKSEAPTCGICHKTKFADGCGHLCSYCQTKFCARCGGRVSLRSNKVTLTCMLGTLYLQGTHIHTHADVSPYANLVIALTVPFNGNQCFSDYHHPLLLETLLMSPIKFCLLGCDSQLQISCSSLPQCMVFYISTGGNCSSLSLPMRSLIAAFV